MFEAELDFSDPDGTVDITKRGFTDHEHLDNMQLIHMNGRMYDYNNGRFLSVDPFIQSPGDSQSVNPYSYLMNNPLAGTDPTGYCAAATGTRIKSCGDMKVEVEVKVDGKTVGSTVVKNVNFKNGADVNSAMSKGAGQIAGAINDIKSQGTIAKQSPISGAGNRNAQSGGSSTPKGSLEQPNFMYAELAEGVKWGDLSGEQQEYISNQDKMISKAVADVLAIPPNSVLDTQNVKDFRDNYSNIKHIFHSERLQSGTGYAYALVPHQAFGKKGKISKVMFSSEVHYSGSSMANFRNAQSVSRAEKKLGYHADLRAGMNGLYDLALQEMGHTFGHTNPVGLTGAQFRRKEESRADSFLKEIRGF